MEPSQVFSVVMFLAGQTVAFITACVIVYTRINGKLKELEVRVSLMEKQESRVLEKLDNIRDDISELKIAIQNKADRP